MAKTICWVQHTKKNINRKNGDKDGKALCKLMNNDVYGKTIENLRKRTDVKLVRYKKKLFQMDIQTKLYITQNIWQWFSCNM